MEAPGIPEADVARVLELHRCGVLDTEADPNFDHISELARRVAGTEIGIVSLVDTNRQWFKSCVGAPLGQQETPRRISFCGHTILQRNPLIIPDARADHRFADNPLVTGEPFVRFYAGFPLIMANGFVMGSLCAISREPHQLNEQQIDSLLRLAALTVQQLHFLREATLVSSTKQGLERERLRSFSTDRLASLERLISREQMVQMIELMFGMDIGSPFTLMRCRFRDYDRVNATLGGLVAEEFMNEGARRVLAAVPKVASVARFADAELVVLLPFAVEDAEVQRVAERVISFASQVYRNGDQSLSMGLALGIATYRQNYETVEAILADTSMAVRMARRSTGSAFRVIDTESRVAARESYRLESDFREAVASKSLEPYLQPIVDLAGSGDPIGFEALARWPYGGSCLSPDSFLPLCAESGLTGELDLLIIEKTLAALPLLAQPIPRRRMTMSVNLSGILLEDRDLRSRLLTLLDDNPRPPGWTLQLELVEDSFQDTSPDFDQFLGDIVARDVSIAIDDFGTGYSSLARLISMPIQVVKVDRIFISQLDGAEDSHRTFVRTMITMLRDLGLSIVAEGVETTSQRDWLLQNGVTKAQGFLFSQPLAISEAIERLQQVDYRPRAIPVDPSRIRAARRHRLRSYLRLPFLDRRRPSD